eukprot:NODE_763_length_1887_cov_261.593182_g710_i0.p1 GENE.NODE_763_length_1887_cov_261.593182_g710_i0~~NODE_763_length_1887_cov_261.593182_g710_i0.p1  ORF type:complete len:571 (-),score=186.27 NODE_763_length_1887_cov_261.593182_g710_i0:126-1838(-)
MYRAQPRRPFPVQSVQRGVARGGYPAPARPAGPRHPFIEQCCIGDKFSFNQVERRLIDVCKRHPRRHLAQDLTGMNCIYAGKSQKDLNIPLNVPITFNLKNTETCPVPTASTPTKPEEKAGLKIRHFARIMLLSGAKDDDESTAKLHLSKRLQFLMCRKEHGNVLPIGGEWSAAQDGDKPTDEALKKTAIRCAKEMIGVDLSACKHWQKFVEFEYNRSEDEQQRTVFFLPDVWNHFPEGINPCAQAREEEKEVVEEVEEEEEDPEDNTKTKTVKKKVTSLKMEKVIELRPYEMPLHGLLEYDLGRQVQDELVEVCLFADCFDEMLQRDFGMQVLEILKTKKAEADAEKKEAERKEQEKIEAEKKRKREEEEAEAAKKQKTEEQEKEEEKAKEAAPIAAAAAAAEPAKPKMKLVQEINQAMMVPFQYFDKQPPSGTVAGHLKREVIEGMLHQLGDLTKHEVDELLAAVNVKKQPGYNRSSPILYYIKLATTTTEVPEEEEEPKEAEKTEAAEEGKDEKMDEADKAEANEPMTEENLNKFLLKDLRTMCTERGLNCNGKKAELVERLVKGSD